MLNLLGMQILGAVSPTTKMVDDLFWFVFIVSAFFFAIVTGGIIILVALYRRRGKPGLTSGASHNTALEIVWSILPVILVVIIFFWGFQVFMRLSISPGDSMEIRVTARKWNWLFKYPDGSRSGQLVVPVEQPVRLVMSSEDVIHSLFIPDFRVKMDVLPNRYTTLWFQADKAGEYDLLCTEFCGDGHSRMYTKVIALPKDEFEKWQTENQGTASGPDLFVMYGCATCHSLDGKPGIGPTMKGLHGKTETLADGTTVEVDDNYLRESILEPQAKIVRGYQPVMPAQPDITSDELDALIDFIKSQQE